MEYNYPKFTPEMKKTHTILIPNMAITQFRLLEYALRYDGYKCEILGNCGSAVAQLGLKYVHNDTCYPALLVIGQFLDALNSGKYDLEHTALLITQTGGGCRASNYIHLLRKALVKAGYPNIPVASLNFSGLEKDSGFQMTLPLARRAIASVFYGDMLCALRNQVAPYENEKALDYLDDHDTLLLADRFGITRSRELLGRFHSDRIRDYIQWGYELDTAEAAALTSSYSNSELRAPLRIDGYRYCYAPVSFSYNNGSSRYTTSGDTLRLYLPDGRELFRRSFDELFTERCDQLLYWPDDELLYTADNLLFYRTDSLLISFSWAEVSRGKHRYVALNVDKFYTK